MSVELEQNDTLVVVADMLPSVLNVDVTKKIPHHPHLQKSKITADLKKTDVDRLSEIVCQKCRRIQERCETL
ncbi:hypothetical protein NECAME_03688 [Necator americanus]|uniref:Uncharacterized protein n=1 Tax=Necator americanus TaxID=51031 RepID=W2T3A8_NECAM|nr:hypothetical protein NECAME_03688 [Necator americanus]ETN75716.1 hypothetical protein NECAME_03688 [Necator americanus]